MKSIKNALPVAPFNLREMGPTSQADLIKAVGPFRYAHGKGADKRATLDPEPCPTCKGKVEWAITYKREGAQVVPFMYARCRTAPKSHRWDFTHWHPVKGTPQTKAHTEKLLRASMKMAANRKPVEKVERPSPPAPRPSVGTELMATWLDKRIGILGAELERLTRIRELAGEVADMEGVAVPVAPIPPPRPTHNGHN